MRTANYEAETRAVMVLQQEVDRVVNAAERVRLVVQAIATGRGLRRQERSVDPNFDFGA